jgi:hypothetical protein
MLCSCSRGVDHQSMRSVTLSLCHVIPQPGVFNVSSCTSCSRAAQQDDYVLTTDTWQMLKAYPAAGGRPAERESWMLPPADRFECWTEASSYHIVKQRLQSFSRCELGTISVLRSYPHNHSRHNKRAVLPPQWLPQTMSRMLSRFPRQPTELPQSPCLENIVETP